LLLTSSATKGTIRTGQFGHLANVIQSGGEEGMWSFDRYQRWMDQQRDWVIPPKVVAPPPPRPATVPAAPPPAKAPAAPAPAAAYQDPITVTEIESEDLQDIAELARQLEQRIP
jgi:twitching motility protein PilT